MRSIPISCVPSGGSVVIRPTGALDIAAAPRVHTLLDGLFGEAGRRVVVDLSGVDFIDCAAIGALVFGRGRAERTNGSLLAVQAAPLVLEVMEITGVAKVLGAHLSVAEALAGPGAGQEREQAVELLLRVMHGLAPGAPERGHLRGVVLDLTMPFAQALARRFANRGQPREDLEQIATVGLLKAVDRYDPAVGNDFAAFAAPTILGEIRRHFRDKGWYIQVPRKLQELRLRIRAARPELAQRLGRPPTAADVAADLGVEEADVLAALEATEVYAPRSLSAPARDGDGLALGDLIGGLDPALREVDDRAALGAALARLTEREQRILAMRFYGNLSQAEIGVRIGVSQMQVSRLLSRALRTLRDYLEETGSA